MDVRFQGKAHVLWGRCLLTRIGEQNDNSSARTSTSDKRQPWAQVLGLQVIKPFIRSPLSRSNREERRLFAAHRCSRRCCRLAKKKKKGTRGRSVPGLTASVAFGGKSRFFNSSMTSLVREGRLLSYHIVTMIFSADQILTVIS